MQILEYLSDLPPVPLLLYQSQAASAVMRRSSSTKQMQVISSLHLQQVRPSLPSPMPAMSVSAPVYHWQRLMFRELLLYQAILFWQVVLKRFRHNRMKRSQSAATAQEQSHFSQM